MVSKAFILGDRISQDRASCNYGATDTKKTKKSHHAETARWPQKKSKTN